jgi:hypothetical protein
MSFFSTFYGIDVRDEIAREFTDSSGQVDDMLVGLHEMRARIAEDDPWLKQLHAQLAQRTRQKKHQRTSRKSHDTCISGKLTV